MTAGTPSPLEKARESLLESTKAVVQFDLDAAGRKALDLQVPFDTWLQMAGDCIEYCKRLEPLVPAAAPLGLVQEATGIVANVRSALEAFRNAKPAHLIPNQTGNQFQNVTSQLEKLCGGFHIDPNSERPEKLDIRRRLRDLVSYLLATSQHYEDLSAHITETRIAHEAAIRDAGAIEKILQELQDAPARWTALKFSSEFKKESGSQQTTAWVFFGAAVSVAVGLTWFLAASIWCDNMAMPNRTGAALVAEVTARGILVLVWLGVITFLFRQYRASAHMAATNRHRAAVLKTYDLIVKSTDDQPTKTALLREAATCIFQPGNTGLLDQKDDLAHQQLLELLRDVALKK